MQIWQTPAADIFRSRSGDRIAEMGLDQQARFWPTPAARDVKGTNDASHMDRSSGSLHLDQLPNFVEHQWKFSHPAQAIPDGPESSQTAPESPQRLNPAFASWLMGWPWWWTSPAPISFAPSVMALYRYRLRLLFVSLLNGFCAEGGAE